MIRNRYNYCTLLLNGRRVQNPDPNNILQRGNEFFLNVFPVEHVFKSVFPLLLGYIKVYGSDQVKEGLEGCLHWGEGGMRVLIPHTSTRKDSGVWEDEACLYSYEDMQREREVDTWEGRINYIGMDPL